MRYPWTTDLLLPQQFRRCLLNGHQEMAEILAHGPPRFSSALHILAVPIVWSTFTLHGAGCHFLNLKVSSKGFPNQTLTFFHQLECKPHMPLSWMGSILPAFSRDSELVLPVLILPPGLRAERRYSEHLRVGLEGCRDLAQSEPVI